GSWSGSGRRRQRNASGRSREPSGTTTVPSSRSARGTYRTVRRRGTGRMARTRFTSPELRTLLTSPSWSRCEERIKAFEEAWRQGQAPALADSLHAEGWERRALLTELVHVELEFRLKAGEPTRVETYLAAYPELARDRRATLELLAAEYELRQR